MKQARWIIIIALVLLCAGMAVYRITFLSMKPERVIPEHAWKMQLTMTMEGHGGTLNLSTFLPGSDRRQKISDEKYLHGNFEKSEVLENGNRQMKWREEKARGSRSVKYNALIRAQKASYNLPPSLAINLSLPDSFNTYLNPTPKIQVQDAAIDSLVRHLGLDTLSNLVQLVREVFVFTSDSIGKAGFSAETDALLALKLREASCNGKSRLAVALLRNLGVPSRLVGGIIMKKGKKKTTHQWAEAWMGNTWVPFDPLNKHLFKQPKNYLTLYIGDEALFHRTANANFRYQFQFTPLLKSRDESQSVNTPAWIDPWKLFRDEGIPVSILRLLLMIPIGALITVIFRNVIGLNSFGTFLPVLIAAAFRDTGLVWGLTGFTVLLIAGAGVRWLLDKLRLLHSPKLTIILVFIILGMLGLTMLGLEAGIDGLKNGRLFPIAILAITAERFGLMVEERGWVPTFGVLFNTLIVVTFCYLGMLSLFLQTVVLSFPEVQLLVIAISIYLGRWSGIRLSEFYRFRHLASS